MILKKSDPVDMNWVDNSDLCELGAEFFVLCPTHEDGITAADIARATITLVGKYASDFVIGHMNRSGEAELGSFCLASWNVEDNVDDYSVRDPQSPCGKYLLALRSSSIDPTYTGYCSCVDWPAFLPIVVECVIANLAPYSLLFYHEVGDFFFHFRNDLTITFYYQEVNDVLRDMLGQLPQTNYYLEYGPDVDLNGFRHR